MGDRQCDCPCKKQRVSDAEEGSPGTEDNGISESQGDGYKSPNLEQMPNLDPETGNDGMSMCSGDGLLECLTGASNFTASDCRDTDTREQIYSIPEDVPIDREAESKAYPSQRVTHDIARVVQDTMAALAENTYIRNKEAGLQAMYLDSSIAKFDRANPIANPDDGYGHDMTQSGQVETQEDRPGSCSSEDDTAMGDENNMLHCADNEDAPLIDRPGLLSDSGFINLFSNCRHPTTSHLFSGDSVCTMQGRRSDKPVGMDHFMMENRRRQSGVNAAGDASALQQQDSLSSSSESSPIGELKIKSLILDSFFKYIPCGNAGKHDIMCRPSNTPFQLDAEYVNVIVNQNNINSLPPQLLVHVFRYLKPYSLLRKVSLVCKYWYNWCRDQDLWRHINLMNQHKLTDIHLQQLISFSDRVISVNLTDCRFLTNVGVKILLARCIHLQVLKLMRCFDLSDESFKEICDKRLCSQLRCLHLDGCCKITDATIIKVAKACPLLQVLHINTCTKITDHGIKVLADHCPRLTQLLMDHCSQVTEEGLEAIVQGCPYMSYLNIMSCGVTDRGVKLLARLTHLTNIDLSNIPRLTPDAIIYLSRHCKNLECINISLNSIMNDECVMELARNLTKLKRLYCVSCNISDTGLEKIAEYRPSLEALDVGWCQDITDHGVRVISHTCSRLDYFGLIRCDQVSVETVEELVLKFPKVNYSTFVLESRRLLERAQREGFLFGLPSD